MLNKPQECYEACYMCSVKQTQTFLLKVKLSMHKNDIPKENYKIQKKETFSVAWGPLIIESNVSLL